MEALFIFCSTKNFLVSLVLQTFIYNGLPVCAYRVRVNRYVIVFMNMLTNIFGYVITNYKIKVSKNLINYMVGKVATFPFFIKNQFISVISTKKLFHRK